MSSMPPDFTPGTYIASKYELIKRVGSGAMGQVWAARHLSLGEEVAIKLVVRDVSHDDGSSNDSRFLLEARVASQLSRKTRHIVSVTDHGDDGPYSYLVMELLEGESLDQRLLRTGSMSLAKVVPLIYQIARALAVAHADGIVHRDLKPSNVFVTVDEEGKALIKILDFGIAKLKLRASVPRLPTAIGPDDAKHKTMRGFLLGTPAYMSPEQARGKQIDHRADVWALAVIAYHLFTRRFPFDGDTSDELFSRLTDVDPIPLATHRTDLPPGVYDVFNKAFAEKLADRYQSAVAFASALEHVMTSEQHRVVGSGSPSVMGSISIPPPSPSRHVFPPAHSDPPPPQKPETKDSSIIAAGVPKRRRLSRIVAASVALLLLLGVGGAVVLYRQSENSPTKQAGLSAGATVIAAREAPSNERNLVPAPEAKHQEQPPSAIVRPEDLPPANVSTPTFTQPTPQTVTTTASLPPEPVKNPPPPVRPAVDKSEVF